MTLSRFSARLAGSANTFTTANIRLSAANGNQSVTCSFANLFPSNTPQTCQITVTYTGTATAWEAIDVFIATNRGNQVPAENLYNPANANGDNPPIFGISSSTPTISSYALPTSAQTMSCPSVGPNGQNYSAYNACYQVRNVLVSTTAITNGTATIFTISGTITANNGTNYQGGTAVVVITPHAVQSSNNGTTSGCTSGTVCSTIAHWS